MENTFPELKITFPNGVTLSFEILCRYRQLYAKPILFEVEEWLIDSQLQTTPQSAIGKAIAYTNNLWPKLKAYINDGRKVSIEFNGNSDFTRITEPFEIEDESSIDMYRQGWPAILNNLKNYLKSN